MLWVPRLFLILKWMLLYCKSHIHFSGGNLSVSLLDRISCPPPTSGVTLKALHILGKRSLTKMHPIFCSLSPLYIITPWQNYNALCKHLNFEFIWNFASWSMPKTPLSLCLSETNERGNWKCRCGGKLTLPSESGVKTCRVMCSA